MIKILIIRPIKDDLLMDTKYGWAEKCEIRLIYKIPKWLLGI